MSWVETKWFKELKDKFYSGISNFFIITGNIGDYPIPGYQFKQYLVDGFLKDMNMEEVFEYNLRELNKMTSSQMRTFDALCDKIATSKDEKMVIIISYPEFIFPDVTTENMSINNATDFIGFYEVINSDNFIKSNNIIVFLTESQYSINKKFFGVNARSHLIEVGFPKELQRYRFIKYLEKTSTADIEYEISLEEFARLSAGLTLIGLEDIYLQAESKGILKKEFILERKKELINKEYGEVIEMLDSDGFTFDDFAGQEHLKKYHRDVIISPMLSGDVNIVPKGLLYTGPPGTGKTHFARCLAGEAGISFVELKMSKILDKWVGESERKFDKALTCIKSITPVGVFIDEIDQAFSRGENDSNSVNSNLFGMFLTILSEPKYRGQIIWIGATNYPNKIDEALKRTGRLDKKIPFLPPTKEDRIKVMKVHLNKAKLKNNITDSEFDFLAEKTKEYTQAELESVVIKALELATRERRDEILFKDLEYATECIVSAKSERIAEMTELAINECNDLEFLPREYKKEVISC